MQCVGAFRRTVSSPHSCHSNYVPNSPGGRSRKANMRRLRTGDGETALHRDDHPYAAGHRYPASSHIACWLLRLMLLMLLLMDSSSADCHRSSSRFIICSAILGRFPDPSPVIRHPFSRSAYRSLRRCVILQPDHRRSRFLHCRAAKGPICRSPPSIGGRCCGQVVRWDFDTERSLGSMTAAEAARLRGRHAALRREADIRGVRPCIRWQRHCHRHETAELTSSSVVCRRRRGRSSIGSEHVLFIYSEWCGENSCKTLHDTNV